METRFVSLFMGPFREYVDDQCKNFDIAFDECAHFAERFWQRYRTAYKKTAKKRNKKEKTKKTPLAKNNESLNTSSYCTPIVRKRSCAVQLERLSVVDLESSGGVLEDATRNLKRLTRDCEVHLDKLNNDELICPSAPKRLSLVSEKNCNEKKKNFDKEKKEKKGTMPSSSSSFHPHPPPTTTPLSSVISSGRTVKNAVMHIEKKFKRNGTALQNKIESLSNKSESSTSVVAGPSQMKRLHENRKKLVEAQYEQKRKLIEEQLRKNAEASQQRIESAKKRLHETIALKSKELKLKQHRAMKLRRMFYVQKKQMTTSLVNKTGNTSTMLSPICPKEIPKPKNMKTVVNFSPLVSKSPVVLFDKITSTPEVKEKKIKNSDNYSIDGLKSSDTTDSESSPLKKRPAWANKKAIEQALRDAPPFDEVFKVFPVIDLEEVFGKDSSVSKKYRERTSSVLWKTLQETMLEESLSQRPID